MNRIFENLYANRELHSVLFGSICEEYHLTLTELLVLLFLDKNEKSDTATDLVEKLKITKSHMSASVRDLEERGYLQGAYEGSNRRTIHLRLCEKSKEVIAAGQRAQKDFLSILCNGFSEDELRVLQTYTQRMTENVNRYLDGSGYGKGGNAG